MKKEMICIVCPRGCRLTAGQEEGRITVTGNSCPRGEEYAVNELTNPKRVITSTVQLEGAALCRLPVKTDGGIPKGRIRECMKEINRITVCAPVRAGEVLIPNVLGTGVNVVATRSFR